MWSGTGMLCRQRRADAPKRIIGGQCGVPHTRATPAVPATALPASASSRTATAFIIVSEAGKGSTGIALRMAAVRSDLVRVVGGATARGSGGGGATPGRGLEHPACRRCKLVPSRSQAAREARQPPSGPSPCRGTCRRHAGLTGKQRSKVAAGKQYKLSGAHQRHAEGERLRGWRTGLTFRKTLPGAHTQPALSTHRRSETDCAARGELGAGQRRPLRKAQRAPARTLQACKALRQNQSHS